MQLIENENRKKSALGLQNARGTLRTNVDGLTDIDCSTRTWIVCPPVTFGLSSSAFRGVRIPVFTLMALGVLILHHHHVQLPVCHLWNIWKIQRDLKRWTHFISLYGLNSKRSLNTRQTVDCGIPSSLLALRVDLRGLRSKLSLIHLTFSSDTRGRGRSFCLHTDSLFAWVGDSSDKCSSSLQVECWNEDETHAVQQSPTQF